MTDPVQEARGMTESRLMLLIEAYGEACDQGGNAGDSACLRLGEVREALTAYAAAIRREEAARVLPALKRLYDQGLGYDSEVEAEVERLTKLAGYHRCAGCGRSDITEDEPDAQLAIGPVWRWQRVERWLRRTGRQGGEQ